MINTPSRVKTHFIVILLSIQVDWLREKNANCVIETRLRPLMNIHESYIE